MGFLNNLFKSRTLRYADELYLQVKQDKEQLITENKELKEELKELNKQLINLITNSKNNIITPNNINLVKDVKEDNIKTNLNKLAKKEQFILDLINQYKNYDDVLLNCKMKESSLKVYISRIRQKGYIIEFE